MARRRRRRNPGMGMNIALGVGAVVLTGGAIYLVRDSLKKIGEDVGAGKGTLEAMQAQKGKQIGAAVCLVGALGTGAALGSTWGALAAAAGPAVVIAAAIGTQMALGPVKVDGSAPAALEGAGPVRLFTPYV